MLQIDTYCLSDSELLSHTWKFLDDSRIISLRNIIGETVKTQLVLKEVQSYIEFLRYTISDLELKIKQMQLNNEKAQYLDKIIETVNSTPALQSEWEKFAVLLKLSVEHK